ncbi:MAG: hypothetical protein IIV43_03830 [Oscillospiraceae bacterium]|nr:hypothetical protein [Oscillospiraceae bacterium]
MANLKRYSKTEAIRIITDCAKGYNAELKNKRFLIAYEEHDKLKYHTIIFRAENYLHLTGVVARDYAKTFYSKCINRKLSPNDFEFDKFGYAHLKLSVLHKVPTMFYNHTLRGDFLRIGTYIDADYFIGIPGNTVSLGFRVSTTSDDRPVTLYHENIEKLTISTQKVLGVWRLDKSGSVNTYLAREQDEDALTKRLLAIDAPLKVPVSV